MNIEPAEQSVAVLPVRYGVRWVAHRYLDEALEARARLTCQPDDEALHDFRVALRRLRSWVQAWRPWFDDTVRKRHRAELREIAKATNQARDVEVQLDWLKQQAVTGDAAAGAAWLSERLLAMKRSADHAALRAGHRFPALSERLRETFSRYTATVEPPAPPEQDTCGQIAAGIARAMAATLRTRLDMVNADAGADPAHEARIAGKRLRYLLEPFRADVSNGKRTINLLRSLQDDFGELHDIDVMIGLLKEAAGAPAASEQPPVRELDALGTYLAALRAEHHARVREKWCGAEGARLFDEVEASAAALETMSAPPPLEIERKYLLRSMPRRRKGRRLLRIDQGWLPGERVLERLRRVRTPEGTRCYRTVKAGRGISRIELEEEIDPKLFGALWPLTRGRRVRKQRYVYEDGGREWVVDRFLDHDLVLAEVELENAAEPLELPDWLEPWIVREVTGDPRYENVNLAR